MSSKSSILLALLVSAFIAGCGNAAVEDPLPPLDPDLGKSYFFLQENKFREYQVYEIRYFAVDISDTLEYQLREEVGESFTGPGGQLSHVVNRFTRDDDTQPWVLDSVWTARVEEGRAISVENNLPMVKMVFPVDTTRRWDLNQFNGRAASVSKFVSFDVLFTVGLNTFDEAMEIRLSDIDDVITTKDLRREVYSDSIGLIFKEYEVVKYCTVADQCEIGQRVVTSGRLYRESLTSHGTLDE